MRSDNGTQLQRVRHTVLRDGFVTRNECLRQRPAITRLASRIKDLEKGGYKFKPDKRSGDYVYRLLWINGVPFEPASGKNRAQILADNAEAIRFFDSYPVKALA